MLSHLKRLLPALLICLLLLQIHLNQNKAWIQLWGMHPQDWSKFYGAFTYPFLHGDLVHLTGNMISLIGLSFVFNILFPKAWLIFFIPQWILSSVILFFTADQGEIHIGASTWLFSFASFLIFFTLRMKLRRLKPIFLILILWFGGMWWGLLPILPHISHEGHLAGMISGLIIGFVGFRFWRNQLGFEWYNQPKEWEQETLPENPYDQF